MTAPEESGAHTPLEPLTRREREVLALLAQGLTGPEIAQRLTLALSSVKWYIQQLYGKLGVNNKRQAIHRATELGLLAPVPALAATAPLASPNSAPTPFGAYLTTASQPYRKHNLPQPVTRFVGRERELAQLKARLASHRLVTLTGSGGVGKTRLALHAAADVLDEYADGIWFVGLAPLTDPALVPQQVAAVLGLREEPGRPLLETLTAILHNRQVLLVLDNCEHLLEACAQLADSLLGDCPRVRLLATSRELIGIAGEAVYSVPSLSFPDAGHLPPLDRLPDYTAVGLFIERARLVQPGYAARADNAAALARICQRLDGIPLAIEMAAARLNLLSTVQVADRLDDAFHLLTGGSRTALPRQRTLRATIDWSYNLLSQAERLLFQRLSVFAGGCTLEAAEAVGADDELAGGGSPPGVVEHVERAEILDLLASLVAKSIVIAERAPGATTRYLLLEVTRQYAQEKLQESGEAESVRRRHRDYFLAFAEANFPKLATPERLALARKLEAEHSNFRLALEWSFHDPADLEAGPRLVTAVFSQLFATYGWITYHEHVEWFKRAIAWCLSHAEVSGRVHARLLLTAAPPVSQDDHATGLALAQQAVAISRGLGPPGEITLFQSLLILSLLSLAGRYMNEFYEADPATTAIAEAEVLLLKLAQTPSAHENFQDMAASLAYVKAMLATSQGRHENAITLAHESIGHLEAAGNHWRVLLPLEVLGSAHAYLGEYDAAREHFLEAMRLADESEDKELTYTRRWLAFIELQLGHLDRALDYCRVSLRLAAAYPDANIVASCLGIGAGIAAKQGQRARTARLSGAAEALYAKQRRKAWEDSSLDTLLPGWRAGPDQAVLAAAFESGQKMTLDQAVAFGLSAEAP